MVDDMADKGLPGSKPSEGTLMSCSISSTAAISCQLPADMLLALCLQLYDAASPVTCDDELALYHAKPLCSTVHVVFLLGTHIQAAAKPSRSSSWMFSWQG